MNKKLIFIGILLLLGVTLSGCVAVGGYGHGYYYGHYGYSDRHHHSDWDDQHRRW